ncbi:MAG: DNA polymerase I [Gemmatimonas sp.]
MSDAAPKATPPSAPRLFLIDGYALIYRAFFALLQRPLTNKSGENTSAAWGIANFLKRMLVTHQPELIGWVHDAGASFREELYPDYKATRDKLTDELQADFDRGLHRITQLLTAYRMPVLSVAGYEADDVIGTLAQKGVDAGYNVVVVSGDKDFQQLVRPGVWLLNPGRGGPASVEESWVSVENGSVRLGVAPEFVIDYLALVGDTSDNVPGVKGIGEKGAQELIAQFGALENIIAHAEEITKKRAREALLSQIDNATLSKTLVTIKCDVPIEFEPEKLKVQAPDNDLLRALYVELEFNSLARGLAEDAPAPSGKSAKKLSDQTDLLAPNEPSDAAHAVGFVESDNTSSPVKAPAVELSESGVMRLVGVKYETIDTLEGVARVIERARTVPYIAIDTETVNDPEAPLQVDANRATLVGLSIAVAPGEAYYLPFKHRVEDGGGLLTILSGETGIAGKRLSEGAPRGTNLPSIAGPEMAALRALLEDPSVRKVAQNAKYDALVLRGAGIMLKGLDFDTMLASYVLDPGRRTHGLDLLALELLGHTMTSYDRLCGKGKTQLPFDIVPVDTARDYSCEDVDMTIRLRELLEPQLAERGVAQLMAEIEVPLVGVLATMEWEGIAIDPAYFASLKTRFQTEREKVEQAIYAEAGQKFNINSNPQLRTVLFDQLKLPIKKKTSTGPSTDASVLQELADEGHVLPGLLMEYRELFKLEGTYIDALPKLVNPRDGRLHTSYAQTVAATGRLSSNDPNLQNIPIRRELGRDIRRGFVPRKGWRFLSADYSQIELRLLAHLSDDTAFVNAFRAGGDIHKQTAAVIFGVDLADVTSEMRARAKTINFATIYGQGAHALSRQLKISNAEAKAFIETYFERFAGVRSFLERCVVVAREKGYAETLFNRRRYIPELKERNFNIRAFGERVAANAPIQGSAADLIKIAMIRIDRALVDEEFEAKMLLSVHDELVFEFPSAEEERLSAMVKREMEGAAELSVPLLVEAGVGDNWLETK